MLQVGATGTRMDRWIERERDRLFVLVKLVQRIPVYLTAVVYVYMFAAARHGRKGQTKPTV
jgi:hypothetical protein